MRNAVWCLVFLAALEGRSFAAPVSLIEAGVVATLDDRPGPMSNVPEWVELHNTNGLERHVTLEFAPGMGAESKPAVVRKVVLDPSERRTVTLPVPRWLLPGVVRLRVDGSPYVRSRVVDVAGTVGHPAGILVLGTGAELRSLSDGISGNDVYAVNASQMPDLEAGYEGVSHVMLLDRSATDLTPGQRHALDDYVLAGGEVLVGGEAAELHALNGWKRTSRPQSIGWGHVSWCSTLADCEEHSPSAYDRTNPAAEPHQESGASSLLPHTGRPPLNAFLLIIAIFSAIIGPGALLFAWRYGRHTLLFTIPTVAVASCASIGVYGLIADGLFVTHAAAQTVTLLDSENHRAVTLGVTGYYSSVSPDALHYPVGVVDSLDRLPAGTLIDWSDGLTLKGGVIPARTYRERAYAAVVPSYARLVVNKNTIRNELGGHISTGVLAMGGKLWRLPDVASGADAALLPLANEAAWMALLTEEQAPLVSRLGGALGSQRWRTDLVDGEYIASLTDGDLAPDVGLRLNWHRSRHLVRGSIVR